MENLNKTSNNLQGTFPASEASLIDIIGTKVETDENGAITKGGWEKLNNTLEMYSDKRYETARYLFVKDGKIVRHVAVSSKTPASTAVKPDDDFLLKLRTYAEETDSKVIFIHNHPSGYVMPSENDVNLTKYLESVFIDNGGKARFLGHAILDHGNYGLYTKKSGWAAMTDGEIRPLSDLDKNYSSDEKNYGLRIKGKEELVALAEKAKSLDSLEIWNKQDWIPAFFASASKIVKSHDYIGKNEFSNTRSLAEKLKSIGRNHNSENVYFFPSTREQQLQCEAFAQTTGLVANIVFRNEDGNFELSDYSGGTLFSDTRAKDISVEDTNSLDRSEIERKLFEATDNNTNETLSTQAKKDGNMKNTNTQTIESNEVVGVGFAPTIQTLRMGASSTRLRASPTTENIIAQDENPVNKKNHIAANFVLEKLKAANIEVIADKSEMLSILESGKLVQKMAAFHGTSGAEKSFNGYGTYVVSVNEGDAKQIGMRVASKKYGDAFYVKGQAFETFLKEHKFSPYWAELLKQSRLDNVEELQTTMMLSDTKGNAELERQKNELSTLFKYGLVEHKREKAFVYSIDIPDDDGRNYLPYENPIGLESAEKINAALERLGTRWRVTRNDGGRQVYFNTLSEKVFGGSQEEASKFLKDAGLVGMRMNDRNYIVFDEKDISVNRRVQFMTDKNGEIYGFAHGGKIYLDPDLMNANTPAHEYTHLWDAYTRQTNLKLWERGKDIFRQTRLWNEVKGDPNYADIADDDDLLLSEVHARICGDIAQKVLERVAEQDGEIARDRAIDWDKEVTEYIASELGAEIAMPELGSESYVSDSIRHEIARNFLAQPMKDLMAGKEIALEREREKSEENALSEEDLEYIRSPEFIEKFGDWEKAQRLEKLKAAEAIIADGKIIVEGEEISENLDYLREDKNKKLLQILARNLGRQVVGIYHNDDLNIDVKVSMNNIDEIKHHNILFENHIEAIKNIPEIIQRAIYIGNESNSDKTRHPNITEYKYFATGLKIDGVDYTCKSVIGVDRNGNNYYDQSLSTIEKGRFVDIVMQKNKLGNLSPLISPWESEFEEDSNPSAHYDKRLINICQVPQMKYLDKNLMPGKEAVEAVRNGTLRIEKRGQTEIMVDEARDAETERIQKMAKPAGNENNVAPSTAAESDYADPIETAEAWHNGTDEEREAMTREFASRRRDAASEGGFARVTAESADAGLFKDIHNEMRGDALARSTEDTLSAFRNIERLAAEAGNDAENGRLAREFVASLEERGVYLYKCGQKNLLRILDTRNLAAESGGIPETVPIEEAGSFFWNHHNVRTDGGKSTYDLMAEAHGTAYRRLHAKEAMREILAANGDDHELTDEEAAMLSGAGFRSLESLGDIEKLAAESGKPNLFLKISGAALGREEAVRAAGVERTEAENAEEKPHTNLHSYSVGGQKITLDRKSGTVTMRLTAADSERMRENNFSYDEMENAWTAELSGDSASFALAMKGELHRANLRDSHEEETTREYPASLRLSEDGWLWTHFDDGSGGLNNYGRTNYGASYDRTTREGWLVDENGYSDFIYIRNGYEDDWNTEEFMKMAEESVERHFGLDRREATVREHVGEKTEAENEYDFRDRIESAIVADNEIGAKYRETFDLDDRLGVKGLDDIRVEMLQKIMEQVGGGRNASEGEVANIAQGMLDGGYAERVGRAKRWEFAEKSEIADPERVAAMDALGIDTAIEIFGTLDEPKEVPFELRSELQSLSATMRLEMRAAPTPGEIQKIRDVAGLKGPETESVRERGGANGAEKTFTMFYGAERKPYHPEQVVSVLKKFAEIDSERWNLPPEAKTAVFHLIDVAEIGGGDFQNSVEKFSRYLDGEEYAREEESYAKILEPILMTEIPNFRNHDGSEGELLHGEFAYEFSAGEGAPARDIPRADAGTLEISGGIKSAAGNEFTGENKGVAEEFQKKLVAAGVAKPDEEFVLVNELEAHARGTRVRESSENDFIILNVPVEADGRKEFVQTKYYHVSALEEPQNIARSAEGEKEEPKERTVEVKDENGQTTKVKVEFGKTKVPEFAMITQNGLKTYADMNVRGHDAKANSWTLANEGGEKIVVPDRTLRELISEKQVERAKGFSENTPAVDKMLVAQYEDFFRQRDNTANNFRHNLSVYCRKEANSPIDALKVAKAIINDMPVEERRRTKDLLKALRKDGETVNEVVVRTYLDAVKETPLNEEHLKANRYEKMIARPMYDTVSANGAKVDDNFDLKIGDTVNGIAFKTGKTFGIGKDRILQNCKIISASKENNMVTLMDSDKSFYDVPRDTFLKEYARSEKVEKKQERKESRKKSVMRIDIER